MNSTRRGFARSGIRGLLLVVASVFGLASILATGGGSGGSSRTAPTVNYSLLPNSPLVMSTNSSDTSTTDSALANALLNGITGLEIMDQLFSFTWFYLSLPSIPTTTERCDDGGTVTVTKFISSPGVVSVNDSFSMHFSACNEDGEILDGKFSVQVINAGLLNNSELSPEQQFVGAELQFVSENFAISIGSQFYVEDGDMSLSGDNVLGYNRLTLSGASFAAANNTITERMSDFVIWFGSANIEEHASMEFELATTQLDGIIWAETPDVFQKQLGEPNPSFGSLTVTGQTGNGVKLTALDAFQVRLDYEFDGDSAFDDHDVIKNWVDLTSVIFSTLEVEGQSLTSTPLATSPVLSSQAIKILNRIREHP